MMIASLPGATALKPGSASLPLPGIVADVVDEEGRSLPAGAVTWCCGNHGQA